jgi:tripartite-type tricarboxylate transporter receptor subunit TctC
MIGKLAGACLCAGLAAVAPAALSQAHYPAGPITLVIPLAPGDATDTAARAMGEALSRELNVPVVPVNKPGAGGALGTAQVVQAPKDGYTIVIANNAALVYRSILEPKVASYNPFTDLTPLGLAMRSPSILAVGGQQPFKTFKEMIDYAKKNPGRVRIGTAGEGSVGDFCVRSISSMTGADITMVPFKGAAPALTATLGGHIEGAILALGTMVSHLQSGAIRGLALSTKWEQFPDIPTLQELGYPQPLFDIWTGFLAPAGISQDVSAVLVGALERVVRAPELEARLKPLGIAAEYSPPDKMVAEMHDEYARVLAIAKKTGLVK